MAKRAEMYIKARSTGRSLADFGHLCDAEMKVIAATREGTAAIFDGALPTARRTVRADLVRFLALGGDDAAPVHEQGVLILGGCIDGNLDLDGCTLVANLQLLYCELKGELSLRGASTHTISLSGSLCSRIHANSVRFPATSSCRRAFAQPVWCGSREHRSAGASIAMEAASKGESRQARTARRKRAATRQSTMPLRKTKRRRKKKKKRRTASNRLRGRRDRLPGTLRSGLPRRRSGLARGNDGGISRLFRRQL